VTNLSEFIVTALAWIAVLVAFLGVARAPRPSGVVKWLTTFYGLLVGFFALRLVFMLVPVTLLNGAILLVGTWLPFAQLRLGEEIVRYHAPPIVKFATLGGAIFFSAVILFSGFLPNGPILVGLCVYQALVIVCVILLLIAHRGDVSQADRGLAETFVWALLLSVPLAMTDFRELIEQTPVRGGAFAMLILLLATSHFVVGTGTPRKLITDIGICLLGGIIVAATTALSGLGPSASDTMKIMAVATALIALAILIERFTGAHNQGNDITHAIAQTPDLTSVDALMSAHPLLSQGRLLDEAALADYPVSTLTMLVRHQIITNQTGDSVTRDAARDLLDRFAASHMLRISSQPPRFLAISAGELAGPSLDDELLIAARLIEAAG
jgi:hypothetical protein